MTTIYKTFAGLLKASADLSASLRANPVSGQKEYEATKERVDSLLRQLNALWSNPADLDDAIKARNELRDAWNGMFV